MSDNKIIFRDDDDWFYKRAMTLLVENLGLNYTSYIKSKIDSDLKKNKIGKDEVLNTKLKNEK